MLTRKYGSGSVSLGFLFHFAPEILGHLRKTVLIKAILSVFLISCKMDKKKDDQPSRKSARKIHQCLPSGIMRWILWGSRYRPRLSKVHQSSRRRIHSSRSPPADRQRITTTTVNCPTESTSCSTRPKLNSTQIPPQKATNAWKWYGLEEVHAGSYQSGRSTPGWWSWIKGQEKFRSRHSGTGRWIHHNRPPFPQHYRRCEPDQWLR